MRSTRKAWIRQGKEIRSVGRARARHVPGVMNGMETRYACDHLHPLQLAGKIRGWLFEPLKLRLGDKCFYSPDFMVITADDTIEFHEVKGRKGNRFYAREDAIVKVKTAASRYPWFRFLIVWPQDDRGSIWKQYEVSI